MKPAKMLALVLLAALASMAFVGASSALAESTALCNTETSPCGSVFTGHVEETSIKVVIKNGQLITCTASTILSETLGLATPQITHVSELTLKGCDATVTVTDKTFLITAKEVKLNEAEVEAEGFEVLVEKFGAHCIYGGIAKGAREVSSGGTLQLIANEVELKKLAGGFFCSGAGKLTATYTVESPKPLYISS